MATIIRADRPKAGTNPVPLTTPRDLVVVAFLPIQFLIAWCAPERLWRPIARMLQPVAAFLYVRGGSSAAKNSIRRILGKHSSPELERAIVQKTALEELVSNFEILRDYRPGGWRPEIRLIGTAYLDAALEKGQGAILWVCYGHGGKLVAKLAIHRAGYSVSHLSRPRHGLSPTKFGRRFLNKIQTTIENRYIAERVTIQDGEFQKAVRSLIARLRSNKVISITVHRDAARPKAISFIEGQIFLADGAGWLAYKTGAALLPVFTYRDAKGMLNVEIQSPIDTRQAETEEASVFRTQQDYAGRLATFVLEYPSEWRGWYQHL